MQWIRKDVMAGKRLAGAWLTMGAPSAATLAGRSGLDWVLLDMEHGLGDTNELLLQLEAMRDGTAAPIVRVTANDVGIIKRALDHGAVGIMAPLIASAEDAGRLVAAMRYPPAGVRGVAGSTPATRYGMASTTYLAEANDNVLAIAQVETPDAVSNAGAIAAVDGVDVLFVGPSDLSFNMGIHRQWDHPDFRAALGTVVAACRDQGKQAGILLHDASQLERAVAEGFTFIGMGVDTGILRKGFADAASAVHRGN